MHNYHDEYGRFPPPFVPNDALPLERRLSWLVLLLPYVEEPRLYNAINLRLAWDSPENHTAARTSVEVFLNPSAAPEREDSSGYPLTHIAGVSGWEDEPNGIFAGSTARTEIRDGSGMTLMIAQVRDRPGPWIAAGLATVRGMRPGLNRDSLTFGSHHTGGLQVGFADGTVRFISQNVAPAVLRALVTHAGGEPLDEDDF